MNVKQEQIENILAKIEHTVGTDWLEKWVHEIKELEFAAAPMKSYRELSASIPPLAVIWCMASDELIMISLTGSVNMTGVLSIACEIGSNMSACEQLLGFTEYVKMLKSKDKSVFQESRYLLAIAAGYSSLGYKPLLSNYLSIEQQDRLVNIICRASIATIPKLSSLDYESGREGASMPSRQMTLATNDLGDYLNSVCAEANQLSDKKPTILYVNIPVAPSETGDLLTYYTKHISTNITEYNNLSQIVLTTGFNAPSKLSQLYCSSSIENTNTLIKLPEGLKPYLPGQYIISEDAYGYFRNQ